MESVIYFSATGNSLRIANIMAERMDGLLLPMSKYKGTKMQQPANRPGFSHIFLGRSQNRGRVCG